MGNKQSQIDESSVGSEMSSAKQFLRSNNERETLYDLPELWVECMALKKGARMLSQTIDDIFIEDEDVDETATEMEIRLHEIIHNNQRRVQKLTRHLERHAKLVDQGAEKNERLMILVKALVTIVNNYMTLLILNIRRLKRLISEMQPNESGKNFQSNKKYPSLIYDVISDQQDVDAMLVQLFETEKHREELERDIVSVLVFWRDYRYLHVMATEDADEIEHVKIAADSVAHGLKQLNRKE